MLQQRSRTIACALLCAATFTSPLVAQADTTAVSLELTQEMRVLARDARTLAAFQVLRTDHDRALQQMVALNEVPAPPFGEQARAVLFADMLLEAGLADVRQDTTGNVISLRRGGAGARTVAVIAHLDTVFPSGTDVSVSVEGHTYSAPGIGDNARGVALLLALARALESNDIQTRDNILFVGSVGEEGLGDLRGVRALFAPDSAAGSIDSAIVIDGGDARRIVTAAVGSNRYRVTFRGPGGHSYGQFGRAHPHQALAGAISLFAASAARISGEEGAKATYSVGRIGGGTSINSIPFESWMEVDMRSTDAGRLAALDAAMRDAISESLHAENAQRQSGDPLTVSIETVGLRPAGRMPVSTPLVQRALAALRELGMEPALSASSTDANIPISLGIPAITISRGGKSRNAHAPNESWQDIDTHSAEQFAVLLLLAEAGLASEDQRAAR